MAKLKLEEQFTQAALDLVCAAEQVGVPQPRLKKQLEQQGGPAVMAELLVRHRVSDGFDALSKLCHTDLVLETLVVQGRFGSLFTDEQVNECLALLCEAGLF